MAGLLLIMEFRDWIKEEALDAYRFHLDIQHALNLEPVAHDISILSFGDLQLSQTEQPESLWKWMK